MRPFELSPILKPKPWGGRRLSAYGKRLPPGSVGESWEVADLADNVAANGRTLIAEGPHAGLSLRDLLDVDRPSLLGDAAPWSDGNFPLLVKLLDAAEPLSIQVHPTEAVSAVHPDAVSKSESWYVVDAEPGAVIYSGLAAGVQAADVEAAFGTSEMIELLRQLPAHPGEFHDVPAGTIHALGAGVLVAEVQTPSDTTYRLYDWQLEYDRPARPLHPTEALESIDSASRPEPLRRLEDGSRRLIDGTYYSIDEHAGISAGLDGDRLAVVMVTEGSVGVDGRAVTAGTTLVIPAATPEPVIDCDGGRALVITLPDATRTDDAERRTTS